jgi:hypothetical protein
VSWRAWGAVQLRTTPPVKLALTASIFAVAGLVVSASVAVPGSTT